MPICEPCRAGARLAASFLANSEEGVPAYQRDQVVDLHASCEDRGDPGRSATACFCQHRVSLAVVEDVPADAAS